MSRIVVQGLCALAGQQSTGGDEGHELRDDLDDLKVLRQLIERQAVIRAAKAMRRIVDRWQREIEK